MKSFICESCNKTITLQFDRKIENRRFCSISCRNKFSTGKNAANYRHGGNVENRPEFNSWRAMKERCYSPKYWCYQRYGGRGIKVSERWLGKDGFNNFLADMGKKPSPKHTLDRIDNEGDYTPDNCRWASEIVQKNNTSRTRYETIGGVTKPATEWARHYNISIYTVYSRLKTGMTFEKAVSIPANPPGKHL